tara:strand:- start:1890 stop:3368 length:1479 start_codon:yes stop_codon:yes gene_type:complete
MPVTSHSLTSRIYTILPCRVLLTVLILTVAHLPIAISQAKKHPLPLQGFSDVVKAVSPTVVFISSEGAETLENKNRTAPREPSSPFPFPPNTPFPFQPQDQVPQERTGSGILIDSRGYIVTNNHVVEGATTITVTLSDRREFRGTIAGTDPQTDLAVITIHGDDLPSMQWSDSDQAEVGDLVLAIGSPFGLTQTVTMGIISALGRGNVGITEYEDFIQTDAAINPGNSGGPLVNMAGDLIGINTAIFSQTGGSAGIGFAIPSNIAQHIVNSLIQTGTVVRGWLGVSIQDMTPSLAKAFGLETMKGALIGQVLANSPAEKAGLKQGDLIIRYENKLIDNVSQIRNAAAQSQAGTSVDVTVIRDGKTHTLHVTVAVRPLDLSASTGSFSGEGENFDNVLSDLRIQDLTLEALERLDLPIDTSGVLVEAVRPNSPAASESMRQGDIIQQIRFSGTQIKITNMSDFYNVAQTIEKDDMIILLVLRQGNSLFVPLQP